MSLTGSPCRSHQLIPSKDIVARFDKFGEREAVIRNARKLKGTGIFINEDLCLVSQEIKNSQLPLLKKGRQEGKIAYFKYTKLIIRNRDGQRSSVAPSAGGSPLGISSTPSQLLPVSVVSALLSSGSAVLSPVGTLLPTVLVATSRLPFLERGLPL